MSRAGYDPGWLRHRIRIERPVATPDGAGGESVAWESLATLWARIEPLEAREHVAADHLAETVSHRLIVRWRNDVAGGMRAVYRGRRFRILATHDPDESRRYLVLSTTEEKP